MTRTHREIPVRANVRTAGFTLIELMITVVVLAILTMIAVPIYEHQIEESRRTQARTALLELAEREERYYATNNAYTSDPADLGYGTAAAPVAWPVTIGSGYYQIEATVPDPNLAVPSYLLTATAIGSQTADTDCQIFTVDSTGVETSYNAAGSVTTDCW